MTTQTRRTTRRTARFFRATVTASLVTACCGLVLWSAVAAHAAQPLNGIPRNGLYFNALDWNGIGPNGISFNGTPIQGMPHNGVPLQGMTPQGMPHNGVPVNGTPLQGLPAHEGSLSPEQSESLPWSTLSQRPLGQSTR